MHAIMIRYDMYLYAHAGAREGQRLERAANMHGYHFNNI